MRKRSRDAVCVVVQAFLGATLPVVAFAQNSEPHAHDSRPDFSEVRAFIQKTVVTKQLPSVSVAVAQHGRILWEESFGWADREKSVTATPHTMYALASLTKPYTSTGLMELVEQHKVMLDHPINEYLGSASLTAIVGDPSAATVRRVLCHTSGLPIHSVNLFGSSDQVPPFAEIIRRYGALVNPPGQYFDYSNLGYGALGYATALVSGLSWKDYMRLKVFLPLRLFHTSVGIGPGLEVFAAARYDNRNRRLPPFEADTPGASTIWASVHDVIRFGMFHLKDHLRDQEALLTDQTLDLMKEPATGGVPSAGTMIGQKSYGLGWFIEPDDHGYKVVSHEGATLGATTTLQLVPAEDLAIAVLINQGVVEEALVEITQRITAAVLPKYAAFERTTRASRESASTEPSDVKSPFDEVVGSWTGTARTWQGPVALGLTVKPDGDIHVKLGDQLETLLTNTLPYRDHRLIGMFAGTMPTPDVKDVADKVGLTVSLRNGRLVGEAIAFNDIGFDPFTGKPNVAISSYVELAKNPAGK